MHLAPRLIGESVPRTFSSITDGLQALADGALDAFVHDAPILRYYSQGEFSGGTRVLPGTFLEQYYGIALPPGSDLGDRINMILLDYIAGEEWGELKRRHLGS